ncbi:arginase [Paralimibaculum aggregatum]|uniref:Arginase n=1 Tax=Paralimibaculum aggregatum TaxID=3036245 RepID=A0ABQ6LP26_9RHOB|nr:arginase [Limibaculum sp. NKW23]GMG82015.1 arginase [Limibaculum sp. NKW23]
MRQVTLYGAGMECGASQRGPVMGPAALRTAGIVETLSGLGHMVEDRGDLRPEPVAGLTVPGRARNAGAVAGWVRALKAGAETALAAGELPIFLGGDHALSAGTVAGASAHAAAAGRSLFVLWLDAHTDFNTFATTESGNLHGTPAAFFCGLPGFEPFLGGPLETPVAPERVTMLGIRSVDRAEHDLVLAHGLRVHDMREIDERGVAALLAPFLDEAAAAGAMLHVSLDVDFLEPEIAPAVGTTVPGGATFREAHLIMEMLHESGLVTSMDIAELNPFLDEAGRTARLMVDLAASLFGRRVMDRQTRSRWSRAA